MTNSKEIISALVYASYHCTSTKGKEAIDYAIDFIEELQAEIEKYKTFQVANEIGMNILTEEIENIKAEAIKEFANKVKSKFCNGYTYLEIGEKAFANDINNLVNEMVGDSNV